MTTGTGNLIIGSNTTMATSVVINGTLTGHDITQIYAAQVIVNGTFIVSMLNISATTVYFGPSSTVSVANAPQANGPGQGTYVEDAGAGWCYLGGGGHGGSGIFIILVNFFFTFRCPLRFSTPPPHPPPPGICTKLGVQAASLSLVKLCLDLLTTRTSLQPYQEVTELLKA